MHILLIHQAFVPLDEPGGTRHHELIRHLTGMGHRVTVITSPVSYLTGAVSIASPGNPGGMVESSVRVMRVRVRQSLHKSFFHRLIAFFSFMTASFFTGLKVRQVDMVWGTSPPIFQGVTAWLLARLKRVPFLFEVRDLWPSFAIAVGVLKNPLLIRMSLGLEHFLYHHADRIIVNSPGYVVHVTEYATCPVELIPNGADPEMFHPEDPGVEFRQANHLEDQFVVLYAGAHGMSNNLDVALCAAKMLQDTGKTSRIRLVFLGDGKDKPLLVKSSEQMHLSNVLFLPPISKAHMADALAGADACLAILKPLDEYKTVYPNKVFDYMAAGRPIILAIDGVIREVVEQACCGLFVQPGDPQALAGAIQELALDEERSRRMGLAGRAYLEEHFSRSQLAARLAGILSEMVKLSR